MAGECNVSCERVLEASQKIAVLEAVVPEQLGAIKASQSEILAKVAKIELLLIGNGQEGLADMSRRHETSIGRTRFVLWFLSSSLFLAGLSLFVRWLAT